jgi:hypothetical protein
MRHLRETWNKQSTLISAVAIFSFYIASLILWRDRVPPGLSNDAAEEGLRGLYLVESRRLEVITFSVGPSAETLYLYLLGGMAKLIGPATLSIQFVSWITSLACIWLIWKLVHRIDADVPRWAPLLAAACSIWLFHYARSGLRAIAAPFFLCVFALLLDRAERRQRDRFAAIACGFVLGLSLYAYTSCRILPIAFLFYAAFCLARNWSKTKLARYGYIVLGAFVASIPNLLFFIQMPGEFISRGSYVVPGGSGERLANVLWSFLLPFYYPGDYRHMIGPGYYADGVGVVLASLGFNPVHPIFAGALLLGLSRIGRFIEKPVFVFLLTAWLTATLTLGIAGPNFTRFLILLPAFCVFSALGIGYLLQRFPKMRIVLLVVMLGVGCSGGYTYFSRAERTFEVSLFFSPVATPLGKRAEELAAKGVRVLCVVSKDASVVNFLTHDHRDRVKVIEFFTRPLDPSQIPFNEFQPDELLVEKNDRFSTFTSKFAPEWFVGRDALFDEVRFPPVH